MHQDVKTAFASQKCTQRVRAQLLIQTSRNMHTSSVSGFAAVGSSKGRTALCQPVWFSLQASKQCLRRSGRVRRSGRRIGRRGRCHTRASTGTDGETLQPQKVVGLGSVGLDYLAQVVEFPKPDEKIRTSRMEVNYQLESIIMYQNVTASLGPCFLKEKPAADCSF